jgi:hypothetical protein
MKIGWCELCECAYIKCLTCNNTSCCAGSCDICLIDHEEFKKYKTSVEDYLTPEEQIIYKKCNALKRKIQEAISIGDEVIDFRKFQKDGWLSQRDEELFKNELSPP